MKVLMSAYACEPNRGSEPGVGWNWAVQVARHHDVWVLTRANNRDKIEAELQRNPQPNLRFIYHDLPKWARWWKKGSRGIHAYYYLWQLTAIPIVRRSHAVVGFDVAHPVTLVTLRFPSALAWLNVPMIWGPIAGGEETPPNFYSTFSRSGRIYERLRSASNSLSKFDPFVWHTGNKAVSILAATSQTRDKLHAHHKAKSRIVPAVGIQPVERRVAASEMPESQDLRCIYVGTLLHLKGIHFAIRAIAVLKEQRVRVTLVLVGDGSFRSELIRLARELGVEDQIDFLGKVSQSEVYSHLITADVFVFPSLHDSGGFAVLEAMEVGLPVICLDLGGPAEIVTDETGIKVPAHTPDQVVQDLARAITRLHCDRTMVRKMGEAGRLRVQSEYTWDKKGDLVYALYQDVLRASG